MNYRSNILEFSIKLKSILLFSVFALFGHLFVKAQVYTPNIKIEPKVVNFGKILLNSKPSINVTVTNVGNNTLLINNIEGGSCKCMEINYPLSPIMKGKSGVITIKYDAKVIGTFRKYITIFSNDQVQKKIVIDVQGQVVNN